MILQIKITKITIKNGHIFHKNDHIYQEKEMHYLI